MTKDQYGVWEKKASDYLSHTPDGPCYQFCHALVDAISTLRQRDEEIERLKSKR